MSVRPVVLITGGSRGIGAGTARMAAVSGYDVCIGYRAEAASAASVVESCEAAGARAIAVPGDMAVAADVERLYTVCDGELGPPTAAVVNAGIVAPQSRLVDMEAERIERVVAVNVVGALVGAREAIRRMSTSLGGNGGSIVFVSSAAARFGSPGEYVDYAATKGAVDTMTKGLATEVAAERIRVNAVRPGLIHTDIHASGGQPGRVDRLAGQVPMARGGDVDEVAAAIMWLLSDEASYVTGALLDVSGGR